MRLSHDPSIVSGYVRVLVIAETTGQAVIQLTGQLATFLLPITDHDATAPSNRHSQSRHRTRNGRRPAACRDSTP